MGKGKSKARGKKKAKKLNKKRSHGLVRRLRVGLGLFLVRGFKKAPARSVSRAPLRDRSAQGTRGLRFSELIPKAQPKTETVLKQKLELEPQLTLNLEPTPPIQAPVQESATVPVPVPVQISAPSPSLAPPTGEAFSLLSTELTRPGDKLKQSIEGFLLDQRSEHTRKAYGKDLRRFMMFLNARNFQQGPEELNRTILIAYKESLLKEKLQHTTVDRHLATLKSFFRWLVEDGLLYRSPADGVRFLNPKRLSTTNGFSDEEVKKILTIPNLHTRSGSMHYAILMVLFYCGLRRSELCSLRTPNLGTEREQRVIRLRGKGNSERIIVMIPPVWSALKHYFLITRRELTVDQNLFTPIRNNRTGDLKKSIDPSMVFYIVTKYAKLAGIANRVSPHSCRATAISNARDHDVPDRAIQEFAGWASPDMITRYDKRKTSVENSAAHSIYYGSENRNLPKTGEMVANPNEASSPITASPLGLTPKDRPPEVEG